MRNCFSRELWYLLFTITCILRFSPVKMKFFVRLPVMRMKAALVKQRQNNFSIRTFCSAMWRTHLLIKMSLMKTQSRVWTTWLSTINLATPTTSGRTSIWTTTKCNSKIITSTYGSECRRKTIISCPSSLQATRLSALWTQQHTSSASFAYRTE